MDPFRTRLVISAVAVTKKSLQNPSKPTRGLEPRTPSLRVTAKEGKQSPPVPPGPINKPNQRTTKDSQEPGNP